MALGAAQLAGFFCESRAVGSLGLPQNVLTVDGNVIQGKKSLSSMYSGSRGGGFRPSGADFVHVSVHGRLSTRHAIGSFLFLPFRGIPSMIFDPA
jgi:hypothetical protein